jgi:hypothetical protein
MPMYSARSEADEYPVLAHALTRGWLNLRESVDRASTFPSGVAGHVAVNGRSNRERRSLPNRAFDRRGRNLSERWMDRESERDERQDRKAHCQEIPFPEIRR